MNRENMSVVLGGISGYINTDVELKTGGTSGKKYLSMLLGRGKDDRGNNIPSHSVVFFGAEAELVVAKGFKKGDLIRVTDFLLNPKVEEGKTYATSYSIVGKSIVKIERTGTTGTTSQNQQASPQPQPEPSPESFDDDIPF